MSTYVSATSGDVSQAADLYMQNIEMVRWWFGPLSYFEVALRNSVHDVLTGEYGEQWWNDGSRITLSGPSSGQLNRARRDFGRRRPETAREMTAGDFVASTSMGLWVGLLHRSNAQHLWRPVLHRAFPNVDVTALTRGEIYDAALRLKGLRNRMAHLEPIFGMNHIALYGNLIDVLASIDQDTANFTRRVFPSPPPVRP